MTLSDLFNTFLNPLEISWQLILINNKSGNVFDFISLLYQNLAQLSTSQIFKLFFFAQNTIQSLRLLYRL